MKLNRYGSLNVTLLILITTVVLLIISLVFGVWAYSGRESYKNHANSLISSAVSKAEAEQQTKDNASFQTQLNTSLTSYTSPSAYGSITIKYPKDWSAYINTASSDSGSGTPLDAYFMPSYLSTVTDDGTTDFALRVQVESDSYSQILQQYDNQSSGFSVTPYTLPKVPSVVGVAITGQIQNNVNGTLIILPLRSQTLEIWTEGSNYQSVFDSTILPNLSFSP